MATEEKPAAGRTIAVVVATAAVTLSIGVTAAAIGGYLVPASKGGNATPERAVEPQSAAPPPAPSVVLVPVAPDSQAGLPETVPATLPEVLLAASEPPDHDDDQDDVHRGRHREWDHEDEHDDD